MFDIYVHNQFLKTPEGNPLEVPTLALAKAIEDEWERDPSPHYAKKPLTSLVATALDRVAEAHHTYVIHTLQALPKDVVLFWATTPQSLVKLQEEKWGPVIEEVNRVLGLTLKPTQTFSMTSLSVREEENIKEFLQHLTDFKLAGFVHLLTQISSFCLSFLVHQCRLTPQEAWNLAHLPEHDQRRMWGQDEEALEREESQREEFFETARFLELIV